MSNLVTFPHDLTLRNRDLVLIAGIGEQYGDRFTAVMFDEVMFVITGLRSKCSNDVLSILRESEHGYRTRVDINLRVAKLVHVETCSVNLHAQNKYRLPTGARTIRNIEGVNWHEVSEFEYTLGPTVTQL